MDSFNSTKEERSEVGIVDFDEIWHECSFQKKYSIRIFFIGNSWSVKITFKVRGAKHILLNISEIIEDIVFVYIDEISVF